MSVDTSRERIEQLKTIDCANYIHMALLDRAEAAEAEVERLREYFDAVEAVGEPTYSHHQIERVDAARDAIHAARGALRNEEPNE